MTACYQLVREHPDRAVGLEHEGHDVLALIGSPLKRGLADGPVRRTLDR